MKFRDWIRPGIRLKRWILLIILGIVCISYGFSFFITEIYLESSVRFLSVLLILSGIVFIYFSVKYITKTFFQVISNSGFKISLDSNRLSNMLIEKRILIKGPKIVVIGGGTGLSTMLRGLKSYSSNLTAIVTVADDGGGSGMLREDLGMLPPGDIRNCVMALADTEPILEKLLQYRFEEGRLKGQSFGNLFLAAMDGISNSFEEAVKRMSDVLAVTGKVLPVTLENVELCAELEDGYKIYGESKIGEHYNFHDGKINRIYLKPSNVKPLNDVLESIKEADIIVLGPGSLFTSVIPNLLVNGVCGCLKSSKALKVYVLNIMTQKGETDNFSLVDHIKAIEAHSYKGIIEYCIVNNENIPENFVKKYSEKESEKVRIDKKEVEDMGIKIVSGNLLSIENNLIRHNHKVLAQMIMKLISENVLNKDKRRELDYYYVNDRLKKI